MNWNKIAIDFGVSVENTFDYYRLLLREQLGWNFPVQICCYVTYGNPDKIYLKGRLLRNKFIQTENDDSIAENLVNMYKRISSTEIANAKLKVSFNSIEHIFFTDEEGYFEFPLEIIQPLPSQELWHHPLIELLDCSIEFEKPLQTFAKVMTPPVSADFGVISDIDDTILPTYAESLFKMAFTTFTKNHFKRFPFPGVTNFYNALHKGKTEKNYNPFFYVSSSPWNLYDLLYDFIKLNHIPEGPLLLKDYGLNKNHLLSEDHSTHKLKMIRNIIQTYPHLNFILIGDSGQHDPEIYSQVVKEFPGRIIAIYIRDVSKEKRDMEITSISAELSGNVEMVYVENSLIAAEHAFQKGFIKREAIELIRLAIPD